jgi:signal transduction histidine kinase
MAAILQFLGTRPAHTTESAMSIDAPMVAFMRCVLAISALAIIYIDPTEPTRFVELTYASLTAYCAWSLFVFATAHRGLGHLAPWIDVGWATYLVALTQGTSSIFFFLFVFAILVASFSGGYRQGLAVTIASSALFAGVGTVFGPSGDNFELNRTIIRTVYLLALGWMMAFWGGREIGMRKRLALLGSVSSQWNPRQGVQRTILSNLERMVAFFSARECLLVLRTREAERENVILYRASAGPPGAESSVTALDGEAAALLLDFPANRAIAYDRQAESGSDGPALALAKSRALANLLDARSFAAIPYAQLDGMAGRLFVTRNDGAFDAGELAFIEQVAVAVSQVAENTQLIDELVIKAAEHERFRISLDIHDSTVQPYIGLKLGLDALLREANGNPLERRIADLLEMAGTTIRDLRGFATGIRERAPISGESLVKAVREQADRFHRFYGIRVHLECEENLFVSPAIASEAFRMISEGLSNIMRHTTARNAFVRIAREDKELRMVIANEAWGGRGRHSPFTPRSINARAISLGGSSFVEYGEDGRAAVHVAIPV